MVMSMKAFTRSVMLQSVVFLGNVTLSDGGAGNPVPNLGGTGVLMSCDLQYQPFARLNFIATAKHVAQQTNAQALSVKFNLLNGTGSYAIITDPIWFDHPDPSVDLSLIPWYREGLAAIAMHSDTILTDYHLDKQEIGAGDPITVTGLFSPIGQTQRMIPIMRAGIIAMMPGEPVALRSDVRSSEVYLVETISLGGLSGAPVFLNDPNHGPQLLGLITGHLRTHDEQGGLHDALSMSNGLINAGVAAVVPAKRILDILDRIEPSPAQLELLTSGAIDRVTEVLLMSEDTDPSQQINAENLTALIKSKVQFLDASDVTEDETPSAIKNALGQLRLAGARTMEDVVNIFSDDYLAAYDKCGIHQTRYWFTYYAVLFGDLERYLSRWPNGHSKNIGISRELRTLLSSKYTPQELEDICHRYQARLVIND